MLNIFSLYLIGEYDVNENSEATYLVEVDYCFPSHLKEVNIRLVCLKTLNRKVKKHYVVPVYISQTNFNNS